MVHIHPSNPFINPWEFKNPTNAPWILNSLLSIFEGQPVMRQTEVPSFTHWGTGGIKSPIIPNVVVWLLWVSQCKQWCSYQLSKPRDVPFTIKTGHSHRNPTETRYFAAPLVAGRLNYRPAPEPCIFIVHSFVIKTSYFDSFYNDNSCIKLYFNRTKTWILSRFLMSLGSIFCMSMSSALWST